ncbi:hypothetical protein CAEBREN_24380 [Caenorhabditis brenneri]|uniref:SET domain-containing protein n=1 Tax=Caenorhabditis brenneri TaxID=135651 RepID=G0PJL1_CAEBE|nr:hypothetical protein CAEBREN_24380 [Caenorhabditis brenneri]
MPAFTKKTIKKTDVVPKIRAPHYVIIGDQIQLKESKKIVRSDEDLGAVPSAVYKEMGKMKSRNLKVNRDSDIGCPQCNKIFYTSCLEHPLFWVPNKVDRRVKGPYTHKTLPTQFFRVSDEGHKGQGVRAIRDIPTGLVFGPYEGIKTKVEDCKNPDYSWDIEVNGLKLAVDAKEKGNWLSLVNSPDYKRDGNIAPFQHKGEMYYLVKKPVKKGEELLVWYGDAFGRRLARWRKQAEKEQQ